MDVSVKRGDVFRRSVSGCRLRTRRQPASTYYSKQRWQPLQSHSDCGSHYLQDSKPKMPTHVGLRAKQDGVERNSVILLEQIRTIDKQRLQARVTALSSTKMAAVDRALAISVGLVSLPKPKTYNKN